MTRYKHTDDLADLNAAIAAYQRACVQGLNSSPEMTLTSSRNWGAWALERVAWEEATQAYSYGMQAIESLVRIQLLRASKEAWLREARSYTDALRMPSLVLAIYPPPS